MSWIDEAEKLALAATPGPWKKGVAMPHVHGPDCCVAKCGDDHPMQDEWRASLPRWTADARHIANWSPDRVLKVLAALRALRVLRDEFAKGTVTQTIAEDALAPLENNP